MLPQVTKAELGVAPIGGPFSEYLNAEETAVLIALVRQVEPQVMLELGCNTGTTAARVLEHVPSIKAYYGVDVPFGFVTTLRCQQSETRQRPGREALGDPRFRLLVRETGSLEVEPELEPCDAIFIDGDHSFNAVLHDSEIASHLIKPGGIIVWHDYRNPGVEVTAALDELAAEGWPLAHVADTWLAFARF